MEIIIKTCVPQSIYQHELEKLKEDPAENFIMRVFIILFAVKY
jgi:hypothetical protein